jgi:hypothetical protein
MAWRRPRFWKRRHSSLHAATDHDDCVRRGARAGRLRTERCALRCADAGSTRWHIVEHGSTFCLRMPKPPLWR